jgi:hypothetical protein
MGLRVRNRVRWFPRFPGSDATQTLARPSVTASEPAESRFTMQRRWRRAAVGATAALALVMGASMASVGVASPASFTPLAGGPAHAHVAGFPVGVCASAGATKLVRRVKVRCSRARVVHSAWYTRRAYRKRWKKIRKKGWRCSGRGQTRGRCWNKREPKSFKYRPR